MTFDLSPVILNYDGSPIMQGTIPEDKPMTYKDLIVGALNQVDATTPAEEKSRRYFLTVKCYEHTSAVDLTPEDIAFILPCIRKNYFPIAVGRAEELFDPKN
jgi:hypothetical protein